MTTRARRWRLWSSSKHFIKRPLCDTFSGVQYNILMEGEELSRSLYISWCSLQSPSRENCAALTFASPSWIICYFFPSWWHTLWKFLSRVFSTRKMYSDENRKILVTIRDLILNERDKRRNYDCYSWRTEDGGKLIAQTLSTARGHENKHISPRHGCVDNLTLHWSKRAVTKHLSVNRFHFCCPLVNFLPFFFACTINVINMAKCHTLFQLHSCQKVLCCYQWLLGSVSAEIIAILMERLGPRKKEQLEISC